MNPIEEALADIAAQLEGERHRLAEEFALTLVRVSPGLMPQTVAERAYLLADAMIERRKG